MEVKQNHNQTNVVCSVCLTRKPSPDEVVQTTLAKFLLGNRFATLNFGNDQGIVKINHRVE